MKIYLPSIEAGVLVGVIYSFLNIRSPAPPLVALVGLFGILVGEQLIPVGKQVLAGSPLRAAWHASRSASHIFGELPGRHSQQLAHTSVAQSPETRS
jgi:XapX domain-containing protein